VQYGADSINVVPHVYATDDGTVTYADGSTCNIFVQSCPLVEYADGSTCDPNTYVCPDPTTTSGAGVKGSESVNLGTTNDTVTDELMIVTYSDGSNCDPNIQSCPLVLLPDGNTCDPNIQSCEVGDAINDNLTGGGFVEQPPSTTASEPSVSQPPSPAGITSNTTDTTEPALVGPTQSNLITCDPNSLTISRGHHGDLVETLQKSLIAAGYSLPVYGPDGDFGGETETAVIQLQTHEGIVPPNGIVESATWSRLCELVNDGTSSGTSYIGGFDDTGAGGGSSSGTEGRSYEICDKPTSYDGFIHNPDSSSLDYLPTEKCKKYRVEVNWQDADYPGDHADHKGAPKGPNEKLALGMFSDLKKVFIESRPNTPKQPPYPPGAEYIANKADNIRSGGKIYDYANSKTETPIGQRDSINKYAAYMFSKLHDSALRDGIDIKIHDGFRTIKTSEKNALASGNCAATACGLSSHNLGLAVDLELPGTLGRTTWPMSNILNGRMTPEHKWMVIHGPEFGWYPWNYEPWHFEFNPPGFKRLFFADMNGGWDGIITYSDGNTCYPSKDTCDPIMQNDGNSCQPSSTNQCLQPDIIYPDGETCSASVMQECPIVYDYPNNGICDPQVGICLSPLGAVARGGDSIDNENITIGNTG